MASASDRKRVVAGGVQGVCREGVGGRALMCRNQKHTPETVWELVVCDSALVGRAGEMTGTSPLAASGMGVGGGA